MTTAEQIYESSKGIVRSRVITYARSYPFIEIDDLMGEAGLIFATALETYNPDNGSWSTHLWRQLDRLNHFCRKEVSQHHRERSRDAMNIVYNDAVQWHPNSAALKRMPPDARVLLDALFGGDLDAAECELKKYAPNLARAEFRMGRRHGWVRSRTRQAWADLREWYHIHRPDLEEGLPRSI